MLKGPKPGDVGQAQLWVYELSGSETPLGHPENTAAAVVLAFERLQRPILCRYLVCQTLAEEDSVEKLLGPVEPDLAVVWYAPEMRAAAGLPLPAELPQMVLKSEW